MARRPSETLFQTASDLLNALFSAQAGAWPEAQLQLFEHVTFAKMLKQLKLCFRPALPAQERRKGHFAKISACVFYEDCGFHAYDYAVSRRAYLCRYKPP